MSHLRLPPNSSPSALPVSTVQRKVRELATGTASDKSGCERKEGKLF